MAGNVGELLRALAAVDRRALVFCAAQCARTVLRAVPADEPRPRRAIEAAEAWARGEQSKKGCRLAADEAVASGGSILQAALAASYAARIAALPTKAVQEAGAWAAEIPRATATASTAADSADWAGDYERSLAELSRFVRALRWPLTVPSPDQLGGAPQAVQVAWDSLGAPEGTEQTLPELIEAHARAQRLGLNWNEPAQRALAERVTDEERVRSILALSRAR